MSIILDFSDDSKTSQTITDLLGDNNDNFNIDNIIRAVKSKFNEIVANMLDYIDRKIYLEIIKNSNIQLISKRTKTIKTAYGKFTFKRRYYHYDLLGSEKNFYPLDELLGIRPRTQYTDGCKLEMAYKASDLTYRQVGENISKDFKASKSTVYRSIKNIEINQIVPSKIINNGSIVHLQIDEKYVSIKGEKRKKRLYTGTIFAGRYFYGKNKDKAKLLNKTVFSARTVTDLANKSNIFLKDLYGLKPEDNFYVSGDLATYIRNFKDRITSATGIYVADKFHVFRDFLKFTAVKLDNDSFSTEEKINEHINELKSITDEKILKSPEFKKLYSLISKKSDALKHYNDETYEGCSQECMNSRIYSVRFGKLTNKFNFDTIIKLSEIKEAVINKSKLSIGLKYKDVVPTDLISSKEYMEKEKYVIDTSGMTHEMRKLFTSIKYGR